MSTATRVAVNGFLDLLGNDLAAVERELRENTMNCGVPVITDIARYVHNGGGKRMRASLVLLSTKLFCPDQEEAARRIAVVVETVHAATLVHDDIIDDAKTRRGRPAANTMWGNSSCVLAGDWLYMQAVKMASQEENKKLLEVMNDAAQKLIEGELLELKSMGKFMTMEEYDSLIFRKTACLFSASARGGAILGRATDEDQERLGQYGHNLGMAFQIKDDVLDLTASEETLGKPVASDLREGKVTLPIIHVVDRCTRAERALIETVLRERALAKVQHSQILDILHRYRSIEYSVHTAHRFAEQACEMLAVLPDSEVKHTMLCLPEYAVSRES